MMKGLFLICIISVASVWATPSVTSVTARQRFPWNGLVDIDYEISGLPEGVDPNDFTVAITMSGTVDGRDVSLVCSNFANYACCDLPAYEGANRVTWDSRADGAVFAAEKCTFAVSLSHHPIHPSQADYVIVDISAGYGNAAQYPMRFVSAPGLPSSAFNVDRYKLEHIVFKRVKACTFRMGNCNTETGVRGPGDGQWHTVTLTKDYFLGIFPMTQRQDVLIVGYNSANPASYAQDDEAHGVSALVCAQNGRSYLTLCSGEDSVVSRLTQKSRYRGQPQSRGRFVLPTEAQWECACRAGTTTKYFWGDTQNDLHLYAWYQDEAARTQKVGMKLPNAWGFYDMAGNVYEHCRDWSANYADLPGYDAESDSVTDPCCESAWNVRTRGAEFKASEADHGASGLRSQTASNYADHGGYRLAFEFND